MNREFYYDFLRNTSLELHEYLRFNLRELDSLDKSLQRTLMFFFEKRLNNVMQKPCLLRICYNICLGEKWEEIKPIAAAFELLNISSYQANSAFDNKLGILSRSEKDQQFIASFITRELSSKIANNGLLSFDQNIISDVQKSICKINYNIYLAQQFDLDLLKISNRDNYSEEKKYLKYYIMRCYYGSGIFNQEVASIGGLLAGGDRRQLESLKRFGRYFGTALHIINDLGDYIPLNNSEVVEKVYQDEFSDLKNGRLTIPLYFVLKYGSVELKSLMNDLMESKNIKNGSRIKLITLMKNEGAFNYGRRIAIYYMKKAKKELNVFPISNSKKFLLIMNSTIRTNKYFNSLNKL